ncbi:hypothetical protein [Sphingomonas carotinifaciens]|uniref:Uncharacterized protein n=1 Tax=Sphingomonas carotinifaciens TaxID=1166323 RepID=A0A1G7QGE0_9SPHN|nr:hypothetical protein [Sphingomonas carotinifaciens]MBB4087695.1 hypothetical protein [Sphingomonas carotinifaciens]MWC44940.1 hypothetical protein [Sphingomonas carotinifaciens]SDF97581.1 hypothetical protein SAMN05216557_108103 [Sphingomonas carotinifaciens]
MSAGAARAIGLAGVAIAYWFIVAALSGVGEPWDAARYWWLWYPLSLVIAGVGGRLLRRRAWRAGVIVTFAQVPVMAIGGAAGPLWAVGLLMLGVLALPAVIVALLAGRLLR